MEVGYYKINVYLVKTTKRTSTILNLKKEKKPFLLIINSLLWRLKKQNKVCLKNNMASKNILIYPIFLPFYLKNSYFKKTIN